MSVGWSVDRARPASAAAAIAAREETPSVEDPRHVALDRPDAQHQTLCDLVCTWSTQIRSARTPRVALGGEVLRGGRDAHIHQRRHYSATELIAAGLDVRTVAGRLGHSGGGATTLRVYSAWKPEADVGAGAELPTVAELSTRYASRQAQHTEPSPTWPRPARSW